MLIRYSHRLLFLLFAPSLSLVRPMSTTSSSSRPTYITSPPTSARNLVLLIGNGPKRQYKSVDAVMETLRPHLNAVPAPWMLVYGGDTYDPEVFDLGQVVKRAQEEYKSKLVSVQYWPEVDPHVDYVVGYEDGGDYGGFDVEGAAVGATAVYMSPEWMKQTKAVVLIDPRGRVGLKEAEYARGLARDKGPEIIEVEAEARF